MAAVLPAVKRLSTRITRILGCNPGPMTLQGTNTYVIGTGRRRILLDTGESNSPAYIQNLKTYLKDENIDIEHIIITHWHHDHIGGLPDVLKSINSDCLVWKHECEELPEHHYVPSGVFINLLKDKDQIQTEGATLKIIHTPGHSTDHIVLVLKEEDAVFSGDCILGEGTAVFEDLFSYMCSLKKILNLNPKVIYPGHGPEIQDPQKKIEHYINHRNKRENEILTILKNNPERRFTKMDIVKTIYTDTPEELYSAAATNVGHHLVKLLKEKKVVKLDSLWGYRRLESNL